MMAFIEHTFFLANSAFNRYKSVQRCNLTVAAPLSYFLENQFDFLYGRVAFNLPLGIFVEVLNISLTFAWNYMDVSHHVSCEI